jgi:hypothetical protein
MLSDLLPGMVISAFSGKLFGCDYLKETTKNPKIPKDSIAEVESLGFLQFGSANLNFCHLQSGQKSFAG